MAGLVRAGVKRGHVVDLILRSRAMRGFSKDRPRASWFARRCEASSGDGASRLLTMRVRNPTTSTHRPLKQLPYQRRDPALRRHHLIHDSEMVGARDFLVSHRQSLSGAMA